MGEPRRFTVHGGWGHHVEFTNFENRRVHGHLPDRPNKGDFLTAEMESRKTAVFKFVEVEYMKDPPDQFFGTVEDVGYADELDFELPEEHKSMFL